MSNFSRRQVLKVGIGATIAIQAAAMGIFNGCADAADIRDVALGPLRLDASAVPPPLLTDFLHMGTARSPKGSTISADSRSLLRDGKPWLPVMGEFHYTRYPEMEWAEELRRMKAGGVDIVATYVFWIHHEEVQGQWDWSGRRDLRRFLTLCAENGLPVIVRCGPWCHGEVRNGGFPDWVQKSGTKLRSADPAFLALVHPLYTQIATQMQGLLWKDGGPVVGIQCDNEYRGPASYLLALKEIAQQAGIDVPLYTRTGWPALTTPVPIGELLPLFGSYAEGFWDRELTPMPGAYGNAFLFLLARSAGSAAIGTDQLGKPRTPAGDDVGQYPYCCCEIGGGMMTSYHRRIRIFPMDVLSTGLIKVGSGNDLQGYYMYQGGTNPEGKLTTLEEAQASGGYNDLPVKTYDFYAPLGEFGQVRPHYHLLRRMHLFLRDWGQQLATMPASVPAITPANSKDTATLRWSARSDGESGVVFVNNYQRLQPMPAKTNVQFEVKLANGALRFPETPVTVPADSMFFWPFNMDLGGATLTYATAQPICQVEDGDTRTVVFAQTLGVPTEFVFDGKGATITSTSGTVLPFHADGISYVQQVKPGTGAAVRLKTADNKQICVVLLDDAQSQACWKGTLKGREHIFLTAADLTLDGSAVQLRASDPTALTVAMLPAPASLTSGGGKPRVSQDGLFYRYSAPAPKAAAVRAVWEPVQAAGPARTIPIGAKNVAEQPADADFDQAAVWRVRLPEGTDPGRDLLLRIRYVGDVARLYLNGQFLDDNFYNGLPFEFGLKRYAPDIYRGELLLKILPLRKDAPIYFTTRPDFGSSDSILAVNGIDVEERHETQFQVG